MNQNPRADITEPELTRLRARIAELETQLVAAQAATGQISTRGGQPIGLDQLRAVFENYAGGMCFSRDGILIDANEGFAKLMRTTRRELIGKPIVDFILPEDRDIVREHIGRGITVPYEHRVLLQDGTIVPVEATASIVPAEGSPLRFTVLRDISQRMQEAEERDRERKLLQTILDNMPAGVFAVEAPSCKPLLVNEYSRRLLRKSEIPNVAAEQLATEYSAYVAGTSEVYPTARMPLVRAMSGESARAEDMELRFGDGSSVFISVVGSPIYDQAGKVVMSVVITRDITNERLAQEKLRAEQDFLRVLIKAHERDRQLLAYEVHDGLVQYITAAVWHLDSVVETAALDSLSRDTLTKSQSLLRHAINDARRVLSGLRPPVLDEQGVGIAIDYLVAENTNPGVLDIEVDRDAELDRLEPLLEGTIFRIVQESLANVQKHSQATEATVRLHQSGGMLHLRIEDNGRGFRIGDVPRDRFGLQGIAKRAELIGGTARIESAPGKGTQIIVELPAIPPSPSDVISTL